MRRSSIRYRLMLFTLCITTIPVIIITILTTNNVRKMSENEIINTNYACMMWADQYLNEIITNLNALFYSLQINDQLMNDVQNFDYENKNTKLGTFSDIRKILMQAFYANAKYIDELALLNHGHMKSITVNYASSGSFSGVIINNSIWSRMADGPISMYFKQSEKGVHVLHSINRFTDQKLLGGISVLINNSVWQKVNDILTSESESAFYVINDLGEILARSKFLDISDDEIHLIFSNNASASQINVKKVNSHYFFIKKIADGQLELIKAIPLRAIIQRTQATMTTGIVTGILFAVASIFFSILLSLKISKPIVNLAHVMKHAEIGNFEEKVVEGKNEISLLENCYNNMMLRIKQLIEVKYQRECEVKDAQLLALQAQINPHFLNNTLNMVGGMALVRKAPEIYSVTKAIGDLLRYALNMDEEMVPISEELEYMEKYMLIQKCRFPDRFHVDITSDKESSNLKIPKLTLQPIVENAFEHGLQVKEGEWHVGISLRRICGTVVVRVDDNGIGMNSDRLHQIRTALMEKSVSEQTMNVSDRVKQGSAIGLNNVNARLKLRFGGRYRIRVYSKEGVGTTVILLLPILKGESSNV